MRSFLLAFGLLSCASLWGAVPRPQTLKMADRALETARGQALLLYREMGAYPDRLPRTAEKGKLKTTASKGWVSGFFPGTLWYLYENSGDSLLLEAARNMTERVRKEQYTTTNHDVGFVINCSFGNGYRLTGDSSYRAVLVRAARSLSTRFSPVVGCTRSWDGARWNFSVIIDNMMNLELLTVASSLTGENTFYDMPSSHADRTMENHFRPDGSSYHLVDYDSLSGRVVRRITYQGAADESSWARGQAWGLYGFTMMYRQTGKKAYLDQAVKIGNYIMNHPRLPKDKIPYWDFDAPGIPRALRDVSAGAIMASAYLELSTFVEGELSGKYLRLAEQMLSSLASPAYMNRPGGDFGFILRHSVGFMGKNSEVDVPLSYADYYFVEALTRLKRMAEGRPVVEIRTAWSENPDRARWLSVLDRVSRPVLERMSRGELKKCMPVESSNRDLKGRCEVTHLEALGRLVTGLAPWLELGPDATPEGRLRGLYIDWAVRSIRHAVDPSSPDYLNFTRNRQPLVDAAFLAHGLLRARTQLWDRLDRQTQERLIAELKASRTIKPAENNWLLFSAMVETALKEFAGEWEYERIRYALDRHRSWYKGDGWYGDGPEFHLDFYNSFVIQPMLTTVLEIAGKNGAGDEAFLRDQLRRYARYAEQQERMISPEGTYPVLGRSLAYRFGAFYALSDVSYRHMLPGTLKPAQVRCALTSVIARQSEAPGTFDAQGWMRVGLCGHQPGVGETYISTGSLYLCSAVFVALGLPVSDPFWSDPEADWTALKVWKGEDIRCDKALKTPKDR